MNAWMRTLPLPQHFLYYIVLIYSVIVGIGSTISMLAFNEPWKRGTLADAAIYTVVMTTILTAKERSRRKRLAVTQ